MQAGTKKTERHHWWPEAVSNFWCGEDGCVSWLWPCGKVVRTKPGNLGVITNGHYVKLGRHRGEETAWDFNFEPVFGRVDSAFPHVINFLKEVCREAITGRPQTYDFIPVDVAEESITSIIDGIISLAVRIPMHRESAASVARQLRPQLSGAEAERIITATIIHSFESARRAIGTKGKICLLFSPYREFIYGDGFFSNIRAPVQLFHRARMLIPLTPDIAVLFVQPERYMEKPRICVRALNSNETDDLNLAVQVYSRNMIFFRSELPTRHPAFQEQRHLEFADRDNNIEKIIERVPGVLRPSWPF